MTRAAVIAALAVGVAVGIACQGPPTATRTDVRAYLQRTQAWAPIEAEAAQTIERILRTEFVDEAEVRRQIADSRPRIVTHLQSIRAYTPHSRPVESVHQRYIAAWEALLRGYDTIEAGFTTGDYTKLARGREAMAEWRDGMLRVAQDLRDLMQRFGVEATGTVES